MPSHADLPTSDEESIRAFLAACAEQLTARPVEPLPRAAAEGAAAFARAVDASTAVPFEPSWLAVLDTIHSVDATPLGHQVAEIAPLLAWEPTFRTDDHGTEIALAPLNTVRQLEGVTVGLMYLGPGGHYPLHSHPPHELYLTIAGHGRWRFGGHDGIRTIAPGATLYNHPGDLHSATAGDTPLVALYVLWE